MIEIQCTSCQTRYRIDERILPDDTPTFKCSRCGHVFSAEPRQRAPRPADVEDARGPAAKPLSRPAAEAAAGVSPSAARPSAPKAPPRPQPQGRPLTPAAAAAAQAAAAQAAASQAAASQAAASQAAASQAAASQAAASQAAAAQAAAAQAAAVQAAAVQAAATQAAAAQAAAAQAAAAKARPASVPGRGAPVLTSPPAPPIEQEPENVADLQAHQEEPVPAWRDSSELLDTRFGGAPTDEAEKQGENLAFNFSDEPRTPEVAAHSYAEDKWEVGSTEAPPLPPPRSKHRIRISDIDADLEDPSLDRMLTRSTETNFERIRPEEVSVEAHDLEADLRGRSYKLHSAGYFIGLFALMVFVFGIITVVIQSAPIASAGLLSVLPIVGEGLTPPISAAQRVALSQVQAQYAKLKGDQMALVISGTAQNLTSGTLGAVRIEAALTASSPQPLRTEAVYCGNSLSSKMLGEMTPHEIEFFEKLDAPKSFTLGPQATAPFVIVFIAPPAGADHFQLRVVSADSAAEPPPATEGG